MASTWKLPPVYTHTLCVANSWREFVSEIYAHTEFMKVSRGIAS